MKGLFISVEGGDGAGKTTQIAALQQWLTRGGREVVVTREPGGTALGVAIREALLHSGEVSPRAEALLYAADRAHHVASLVRPALERGAVVISDRYFDSSVAYQGAARSLGKEEVRQLSLWATDGLVPQLTVLLDVPVAVGASRVGGERDRIESAGLEFHEAVRAEFLHLAAAEPERWVVVDGTLAVDEVTARVCEAVRARLLDADGTSAGVDVLLPDVNIAEVAGDRDANTQGADAPGTDAPAAASDARAASQGTPAEAGRATDGDLESTLRGGEGSEATAKGTRS
ncbi:dTMP kinase [Actinobaculum sp. 352]|uniref:dTMP kinase n=1 Tax=Actinobaculum sp. 352 TaxID=2490946 RepID=UPI000F7E94B1|nr:dTMP kinase [Actinobaculum sp. 352]RTE49244.1 dTMP kinase [Actinobaculum sp. 352]